MNSATLKNTQKIDIRVAHLVRRCNGLKPFKEFLESYKKYKSGIDHDLIIIFKGFSKRHKNQLDKYYELLNGIPYKTLFVSDFGFDMRPYFLVVKAFDYKYYCFLNSFSIILDSDWLLKMYNNMIKPNVGMVGATGSWKSHNTPILTKIKMPPYCRIFVKCLKVIVFFPRILRLVQFRLNFDPFPNYHLRTNGFMISKEVMQKIRQKPISTKMDAWKMESGKRGLTKQVLEMNLKVLVVGKDGRGYEKEDWYKSGTFCQGDQHNLLISDNQTKEYFSDPKARRKLCRETWGDKVNSKGD
jgi:hypothetical protein